MSKVPFRLLRAFFSFNLICMFPFLFSTIAIAEDQSVITGCRCTQEERMKEIVLWELIIKVAVEKNDCDLAAKGQCTGRGFIGNATGYGPRCNEVVSSVETNIRNILAKVNFNFICTSVAAAVRDRLWGLASHAFLTVVDTCNYDIFYQYDPWRTGVADQLPRNYQPVSTIIPIWVPGKTAKPPSFGSFEPGYPIVKGPGESGNRSGPTPLLEVPVIIAHPVYGGYGPNELVNPNIVTGVPLVGTK